MSKLILAASAASLALAAPALAEKGGHHGGQGKAPHAKADRGPGKMAKADRAPAKSDYRHAKADRGPAKDHNVRVAEHGKSKHNTVRTDRRDRYEARYDDRRDIRLSGKMDRGLVDGCPPGLAKKNNGCMPPGQAKKMLGSRVSSGLLAAALPSAYYSNWYRDDPRYLWRENDGYLYRIDRDTNVVSGLMPLFDTGYYPVGSVYPSAYNFYNVPTQYRDYYPSEADYLYRYGDGAIYGLDPTTNLVNSIVALVAGDLAVGQPMPSAYSVYNVPLAYRSQYVDTPDNWYRYNDGYIYRVDPTTQLVSAIVQAII